MKCRNRLNLREKLFIEERLQFEAICDDVVGTKRYWYTVGGGASVTGNCDGVVGEMIGGGALIRSNL